jgi:hypothetical protein
MNVLRLIPRNKPRTGQSQADVLARVDEDVSSMVGRNRFMGEPLEFGPNWVHAVWGHGPSGETGRPGTFTDLGWAKNLKTTTGMTWLRGLMGGVLPLGSQTISSTPTATTYPTAGTPYTASQLVGMRIVCPITNIGTSPVYGNIGANTTAAITVDKWWTQTYTTGTTPAAATMGLIVPGLVSESFIGLSDTGCTPAIGNTSISSSGGVEYITVGLERAQALYADTASTTFTQYKLWTASGAGGNVKTAAAFTCLGPPATAPGIMVAITDLNAQANLAATDTLAVTWTWTIPAAG